MYVLMVVYLVIVMFLGACIGAVAYQQYLLHHPDLAQEICRVARA